MTDPITSSEEKKTIAFLGATGGVALAALVRSIRAGHQCTALVRNPTKLQNLLSPNFPEPPSNLHLTTGDATSPSDVHTFLASHPPDTIVFSIGGSPKFSASITSPITIDQPNICADGMEAVLSSLRQMRTRSNESGGSEYKYNPPLLVAVSTTGTGVHRDVPLLLWPLYKYLLHVPHEDKKKMESLLMAAGGGGEEEGELLLKSWIIVLPTLLTDGAALGSEKVRAGYEGRKKKGDGKWGDVEGEAVGYSISREDVGQWIFEEVVESKDGLGGEWKRRRVTLAY